MHLEAFLADAVVIFLAGILAVLGVARVGLPPVVGFLVAGLIVGPHALGLVADAHTIELLAEVGVALLLFTIGIELSFERLRRIGRSWQRHFRGADRRAHARGPDLAARVAVRAVLGRGARDAPARGSDRVTGNAPAVSTAVARAVEGCRRRGASCPARLPEQDEAAPLCHGLGFE